MAGCVLTGMASCVATPWSLEDAREAKRGDASNRGCCRRCGRARLYLAAVAGCGNPQQSVRHCQGAPEESIVAIQQKVTAQGKLRNGKMVHLKSGPYFVSAEIHLDSDASHDKGDIATWATDDIKSTDEFQSVDVHAREESTWPHASFDVTADGAIESRACVGLNTGKTKAQIQCEQRAELGRERGAPVGQGLQRPMSVTTDLSAPEQPESVPPRAEPGFRAIAQRHREPHVPFRAHHRRGRRLRVLRSRSGRGAGTCPPASSCGASSSGRSPLSWRSGSRSSTSPTRSSTSRRPTWARCRRASVCRSSRSSCGRSGSRSRLR